MSENLCPFFSLQVFGLPSSLGSCTKYGSYSVNLGLPWAMLPCTKEQSLTCPIFQHQSPMVVMLPQSASTKEGINAMNQLMEQTTKQLAEQLKGDKAKEQLAEHLNQRQLRWDKTDGTPFVVSFLELVTTIHNWLDQNAKKNLFYPTIINRVDSTIPFE